MKKIITLSLLALMLGAPIKSFAGMPKTTKNIPQQEETVSNAATLTKVAIASTTALAIAAAIVYGIDASLLTASELGYIASSLNDYSLGSLSQDAWLLGSSAALSVPGLIYYCSKPLTSFFSLVKSAPQITKIVYKAYQINAALKDFLPEKSLDEKLEATYRTLNKAEQIINSPWARLLAKKHANKTKSNQNNNNLLTP